MRFDTDGTGSESTGWAGGTATRRQDDMRLALTVATMDGHRRERLVCVAQHTRPLPCAGGNRQSL
jgi:hypothetical protein